MCSPNDLIVRCVIDTGFLEERIAFAPTADGLDFRRVRTFTGLITKVQNNQLWEEIPATLRLLTLSEIALDVFASYRRTHLRVRSHSPHVRTAAFMEFFQEWMVTHSRGVPFGVVECFTHEHTLWCLRKGDQDEPTFQHLGSSARIGKHDVPRLARPMRIARYSTDPLRVVDTVMKQERPIPAATSDTHDLLYVLDRGQIRILAVDPLTASLLSLVSGEDSVNEICATLRSSLGIDVSSSQALHAFQCLGEQELLIFEGGQ